MDYEKHYTYSNARNVILLVLAILFINYYFHPTNYFMQESKVIEPVNNTVIIYKNITVTVTPTPDGKNYFAGEYENGIRKLGRPFSWLNKDVMGKEDMSGHVKVYDWRKFESLHIFNPTEYKYYEVRPNDFNNEYFIIFVKIYLDDVIGDNTHLWLPNESHFYLQSKDTIYYPARWDKQLRIKEFEETWNDNNNHRIGYYGTYNAYSRDLQYANTAGEIAIDYYWVIGGESNAIDGYIIYEIPKGSKLDEICVLTDLYAFGNPAWSMIR